MYDAIVLAGGSARRLDGVDKPALEVGGATLLERVLAAVGDASRVVVVGPRWPAGIGRDVRWCREEPPGGGPVAALAVGLPLTESAVIVVLAADLPAIGPAVPLLVTASRSPDVEVAMLADATGRPNHLAAAWRRPALVAALARVGAPAGAAMRSLAAAARTVSVPDAGGWGADCDTWDDVARARRRFG